MPVGVYTVMDGKGNPVGTESFRAARGPAGWRYFAEIETSVPTPHRETVDLVTDAGWNVVLARIDTGEHRVELRAEGDALRGTLDGEPLETRPHIDYLSPCFNAYLANSLDATTEADVTYLDAVTCRPRPERQRYELLGEEQVGTPVGTFAARHWRYSVVGTGTAGQLWIAGDIVVRYESLYELREYQAGASGPSPA